MYQKVLPAGTEYFYFFLGSQVLGKYRVNKDASGNLTSFTTVETHRYFAGRRIGTLDRLGSDRAGGKRYYPYGEEMSVTAGDGYKFGTYYRHAATGLDYADQRWYSSQTGRFLTPDPYIASGGPGEPGSWNRYGYVEGDPFNRVDPFGLDDCPSGLCVIGTTEEQPVETGPSISLLGLIILSQPGQTPSGFLIAEAMRRQKLFQESNMKLHGEMAEGIRTLSPDCFDALKVTQAELVKTSHSMVFYESSRFGDLTQHQVVHNGIGTKLANTYYNFPAVVLNRANGTPSNVVLIRPNFYSDLSEQRQRIVLVHELLHVKYKLGDERLRGDLKVPQRFKGTNSTAITDWLAAGCPKE